MAQGFYLKTAVASTFNKVTNFFVKTTTSGWAQITDAWVKTDAYTWSKFFTAKYSPDTNVELLSGTGADGYSLTLQGKNKHWSPNPTSLKYYFSYIDSNGGTYYIGSGGSSGATATNPSSGSSIVYPSSTTYITIDPKGTNYSRGGTATYYFEVRAFDSGGTAYPSISQEVVTISTPKAPIVTATPGVNSITLSIKSASSSDWFLTNRYIVYTSDAVGGLIETGGGRGGYAVEAAYGNTRTVTLTGLVGGRSYDIYVATFNGSSGSTTGNATGYAGAEAYVSATPTSPYTFTFGNTLHIGTNGYISFDSGSTSDSISSTTGRVLGILPGDLFQATNSSIWYWSNTTAFIVRWEGYHFNQPSNTRIYEVTFYNNQSYATVYADTVTSTTEGTAAFVKDGVTQTSYPSALSSGTAYNVNFDGTTSPASYLGYTPKAKGVMVPVSGLTSGTQDQGYTSIVTSTNQQTSIPANTSVPTWTLQSGTANQVGAVYRLSVGSWSGNPTSYTIHLFRNDQSSNDTSGFPVTIYSPNTYYDWTATSSNVSLALAVLASNGAGTSGYSYATSSFGPIVYPAPVQTTAPKVGSSLSSWASGGYIDILYPNSVYWSGGSYSNASSVTSVLMYTTAPSNFSSPTSDTTTNYRTANPYALASNDGTGTPYYFAVRDTVVGTNGTTYYYYSYPNSYVRSQPGTALTPTLSAATGTDGGFYFDVSNYDSNYTWSASVTTGTGTASGPTTTSPYRVTVTGMGSAATSTVTVSTSRPGYNGGSATRSGTSNTVVTYTLTYAANGGSTTPSSQTGANGATITLASGAGTRSGFSFGGWNIGGTTYAGGASYTFGAADATATAIWNAVFVTPVWNGTMPKWSTTAPSNFQRITTGTANFKWGWGNGTFSFSGSVGTSKGWNFHMGTTQLAAGVARTYTNFYGYTTTNDTYTTVNAVSYPYIISSLRGDVTYSASARYGSIQPYQFGTDGNEYDGTWTAGI